MMRRMASKGSSEPRVYGRTGKYTALGCLDGVTTKTGLIKAGYLGRVLVRVSCNKYRCFWNTPLHYHCSWVTCAAVFCLGRLSLVLELIWVGATA